MNFYRFSFLLLLTLSCYSCQQDKQSGTSELRIISMVPNVDASLTIQSVDQSKTVNKNYDLDFGTPVGYTELKPGYYQLTYWADGRPLLKGTYVMGKNGHYTLLISGLKPDTITTNPETPLFTIEQLLTGSEARGSNGYLPRWFLLRDDYDGSIENAYFRVFNASSNFNNMRVTKDSEQFASVSYPQKSNMQKVAPASHHFQVFYGDVEVGSKKINIRKGYIYTLIVGDPPKRGDAAELQLLENPSLSLLNDRKTK